jgi:hypothetical protein
MTEKNDTNEDGFPTRVPRGGSRVHHDRLLTPSERRDREEARAKVQKAAVDKQDRDRKHREPGGWAGRRRGR